MGKKRVSYFAENPYTNIRKNSFAKFYLKTRGIKLFQGKDEILICPKPYNFSPDDPKKRTSYPSYWKDYPRLKTRIQIGNFKEEEINQTMTFSELQRYGIYIKKIPVRSEKLKSQGIRGEFVLTKNFKSGAGIVEKIPEGHSILHDVMNERIKIIGINSDSGWIYLSSEPRKDAYYIGEGYYGNKREKFDNSYIGSSYTEALNKKEEFVEINELPILISKNKLVCIPDEDDEPTIGIFGMRGRGKTTLAMSLLSHAHHKWKKGGIILNDGEGQTLSHTLPCNYGDDRLEENSFEKGLKKIGEEPRPLPIVPLIPYEKDLNEENLPFRHQNLSIFQSLPIKELINNLEMFLKGEGNLSLGKTGKYIEEHKEELLKCRSEKDLMEKINNLFGEENRDVQSMRRKALNRISTLLNEKIFDINTVPSELEIDRDGIRKKYLTIQALAISGLIPSLQTGSIMKKYWRHLYLRYIIKKIFDDQVEDAYIKSEKMVFWIFLDELESLIDNITKEEITDLFLRGRFRRVGVIYATLNFMQVPPRIQNQTLYSIIFRTQHKETLNAMKKNYDLDNSIIKEIQHLGIFEAMIIGSDRKFICYNLITGERTQEEGPFRGKIIPPLSLPQKPR